MDTTEIDLREIVAIFKRQRRLIVATIGLCLGLALAFILTATPLYRATTLLLLDGRETNLLDPGTGSQAQSAVLNARVDGEVEILRSDATVLAVVGAADLIRDPEFGPQLGWLEKTRIALGIETDGNDLRRRFGLSPRPPQSEADLVKASIGRLKGAITIRRQGLTYLIAVSAESASPERAAAIANIYADTYIQRQIAAKTRSLLDARDVLNRQLAEAQNRLVLAENAVNGFIETNLAQLERESGDPAVAELRRSLEAAQARQAEMAGRLAGAEGAIAAGNWDAAASSLGDAAMAELARQRTELERRLAGTVAGTTEAVDLASELARIETDLSARSDLARAELEEGLALGGSLEAETRDALRSTLLQSGLSAEMLSELFNLQQTATNARNQYQTLLAREQDMGTLASLQVADARIVSEALPPDGAAAPNRRMILMLALVGGLGLGVALAFLREFYIGGITSESQLRNILQLRVPATVPQSEPPEGGSLADTIVTAPMSPYAETFRKLRAVIDMDDARGDARGEASDIDGPRGHAGRGSPRGRVLLISSALQAEGKTTTAVALARTYALSGLNTLLIDADLRKPAIADRLGVSSSVGLLDYLSAPGDETATDLQVARDPLSALVVLTAGGRSATPTDQLVNSPAFNGLITGARQQFDIVIIDSPPLLPVVDTRYLARHADGVVLVVRYGTTTQGEAREAAGQLAEMKRPDARIYAVLSHAERDGKGYGRYYSYYGKDED
ncbi:GumC family protein [Pseudogemmobacter sonorensis]|uniref:GumC family protein n=1 Tax=Pseudogemmobacter sonorensis TaxID=2989681 RepID=UPI0036C56448